ncbi:MAG TPA: polyprenyl synthetase family protein [Chitinophagaceae bacterium]|jgi:octaprenyl-diphosphate synthase|nr:polyprenyl synthetase family protein [Chitinophagaceae bacterium]
MNFSSQIIAEELKIFESRFKDSVKSNVPLLDRIMKYVVKTKGKQLRPMFVLLSAKMTGSINESTYRAASLVELLHTATLVHDDVVDESMERRGVFSVYALWKAKVSVLVGDYLLAKGLLLSLDNDDFKILQILSRAVKEMSEGELLQLEKSRSLNLDEDIYFRIITNKTASLLASACSAGAYSASKDLEIAEKMRLFGEKVGIAFQIKDDLFDYGKDDVGKPTGNDIKEKKVTLPLIYTLNNVDRSLRKELIYIIKNQNRVKEKIDFVISKVEEAGGIRYATEKMNEYRNSALQILEDFPASETRETLADLVNFTTDRKK